VLRESLLYALLGAALGLWIAAAALKLLWVLAPDTVPRLRGVRLDGGAVLFTAGAAMIATLLCGLWPALLASRQSLVRNLREGGRGLSQSRRRARQTLVTVEFALASVLLLASGLVIKNFLRLAHVDPGFEPRQALAVSYYLPANAYPREEQRALFMRKLLAEVASVPGIRSAGTVDWLPFSGDEERGPFDVQGQPRQPAAQRPQANLRRVSPDYFRAMRIPLRRGRAFTPRDIAGSRPVAIVNETMARRCCGGSDPIGRLINLEPPPDKPVWRETIGVVGDVKHMGPADPSFPDIYLPAQQQPGDLFSLVVRTPMRASEVAAAIGRATRAVDPEQPAGVVAPLTGLVAASLAGERAYAALFAIFAGAALLLAVVGVSGLLLHSLAQRTREIGIRMAIGATPGNVQRLILWQALRLSGIGILAGTGVGLAVTRAMSGILSNVSATDPAVFLTAPMFLGGAAIAAGYLATRRVRGIDPVVALRHE
jgi:putative ABC transport system permease protein